LAVAAATSAGDRCAAQAPVPQAPGAAGNEVRFTPIERIEQALERARVAANNGDLDGSFRELEQVLGAGPATDARPAFSLDRVRALLGGPPPAETPDDNIRRVESGLLALHDTWVKYDAPPERVYESLVAVVLPESRPGEVFPYPRPIVSALPRRVFIAGPGSDLSVPEARSAGFLLVEWAVKAGRQEALRARLDAASKDVRGKFPAAVVLAQLELAESNHERLRKRLESLHQALRSTPTHEAADLALHAALPALADPRARDAALPLVEQALEIVAQPAVANFGDLETVGSLMRLVARAQFASSRANEGHRTLQKYLSLHEAGNRRFGGDYPQYLRKQQLGVVALELLRAGQTADALNAIAEQADISVTRYGDLGGGFGWQLARELARIPAAQRYHLLHDWTLPSDTRLSLRVLTEFIPVDRPPAAFAALVGEDPARAFAAPGQGIAGDVFSTASVLLDAAREVGRLDELAVKCNELAASEVENARELAFLAEMARGNTLGAAVLLDPLVEAARADVPALNAPERKPYPHLRHLVASVAAQEEVLVGRARELLRALIQHAKHAQVDVPRAHARWALALSQRASFTRSSDDWLADARPAHWTPGSYETARQHAAGSVPTVWVAHDGLVSKLAGPYRSNFYFRYPLAGDFEFSVDATDGDWAEGNVGYDALTMQVWGHGRDVFLVSVGEQGQLNRIDSPCLRAGKLNRQTVRVANGRVQYLVNGYRMHEDDAAGNPWLALNCDHGRTPVFSNLRLVGAPVIPREVPLLVDDRMRGWVSEFYAESRPDALTLPQAAGVEGVVRVARAAPIDARGSEYDWYAAEGVLHGRRRPNVAGAAVQSRLFYHRPLQDGERVAYEFLYEPGRTETHPALGRLAFLVEPAGIAPHWMTDGDFDATGLPPDNRLTVDAERRGEGPLPLKIGDWNEMVVSLREGRVSLRLNGTEVYEHDLAADNDRLFGFFHDRARTAAQVRRPVLTGDWPEQVSPEILAGLSSPVNPNPLPGNARTLHTTIGEKAWADNTYSMYQDALRMIPEERFAFLRQWVMPHEGRARWRMFAATTPSHPAPPVQSVNPPDAAQLAAALPHQPRRVEIGGNLVSPALELVSVARELGRLEDLHAAVASAPANDPFGVRSRLALLTATALAVGRADEARAALIELLALTRQNTEFTAHLRWPEVIAAHEAVLHPATRQLATELMDLVVREQLQKGRPGERPWEQQARWVRGLGWWLQAGGQGSAFGTAPPLAQWQPVSQTVAQWRSIGCPVPQWHALPGAMHRLAAHDADMVYFAVPLRGDYTVECEESSFGYREVYVSVAGLWTRITVEKNKYDLGNLRRWRPRQTIEPAWADLGDWHRYRVEVNDGMYTSFVNDRQLHQEQLPAEPDPWISFHAAPGTFGGVRNFRITGTPLILEELHLTASPELHGWVFSYYGQTVDGENPDWRMEGDTLVGRQRPEWAGMSIESLIRYHRPLLEDGEIDYEFFHQPGVLHAHPALDRLVLLLTEEGVRVHWLTDGAADRTGLGSDNVTDEPHHRRGPDRLPLRPDDWNRVRLSVTGDTLALVLNGELVYERPLEPTNLRLFGLFHYSDQTGLRVRQVKYRGNWPKTLPPVEQQELAGNPAQVAEFPDSHLPVRLDFDFTGAKYDEAGLTVLSTKLPVAGLRFHTAQADGLHLSFIANRPMPETYGVTPRTRLRGDFDVAATFEGLALVPPAEQWGTGVELAIAFESPQTDQVRIERRVTKEGLHTLKSARYGGASDGASRYLAQQAAGTPTAGTMRIVRRGEIAHCLFAEADSDEYRLLWSTHVGTADVTAAVARLAAGHFTAGADVVLKRLVVRAEELVTPAGN
jgi:hypothetical protein